MKRRDLLRAGAGAAAVGVGVVGTAATADSTAEYDVTEGYEPLGRLELEDAYEAVVSADGQTAYVALGDGYATVDLSAPTEPTLLASRRSLLADHEAGPMDLVWDLKVDGDDLLVVGPAHRRAGVVDAAVHVDVSDPATPRQVAVHDTDVPIHNCDVADGYAYLTGNDRDRNPVVVVDLERAVEVARWSVIDHDAGWTDVDQSLRTIHDVWVHDDVAYAAYWDAGTHLLDVSDPTDPTHLGSVEPYAPADLTGLSRSEVRVQRQVPPGNHHFAAPNEDGTLMAVNVESWAVETDDGLEGGPGGVHLYDLADPTDPERLASIDPPETPAPTTDGVWTTSHNFELRGDRLYSSWYEGGVKVHDVSDPTDPEEIAWWRDPVTASFWTAQAGVPGEFVVASSTGHRPTKPAIYTFPDRPGEQTNPRSMQDALDARDASPTPTPTLSPDSPSTPTPSPTTGSTPTQPPTEAETVGFGIGAGATAVGGVAWWLRRRALDDGD